MSPQAGAVHSAQVGSGRWPTGCGLTWVIVAGLAVCLFQAVGCQGRGAAASAVARRPGPTAASFPAPLPSEGLATALPAGASWVAVLRPVPWQRDPAAAALLAAFLPPAEQPAFQARYGAGLAELSTWVVAAYGDDRVHLFRAHSAAAGTAVDRMGQARGRAPSSRAAPSLRPPSVTSPSLAFLDARTWVVRERGPARTIQLAVERGRGDPALAALGNTPPDAALTFYVPGQLPVPEQSPLALALARQRGARLTVSLAANGELSLTWNLHGEFPTGIGRNLRAALASWAQDPFGVALGLPEALPRVHFGESPRRVTLAFPLQADQVRSALRPLTESDPWRLLVAPDQS